ncbi:hypothetical protein AMTRI_Chr03g147460 [Amborella trichopoda]
MASESHCPGGKRSWPELVGMNGVDAAAIIRRENPEVRTSIVPSDRAIATLFKCDRVVVWVDEYGNVRQTPVIG